MRLFEDIIDDVKDVRDVQDDQSSSEIIGANSDYIEEDTNPEIDRSYRFIMIACYSKDVDDKRCYAIPLYDIVVIIQADKQKNKLYHVVYILI